MPTDQDLKNLKESEEIKNCIMSIKDAIDHTPFGPMFISTENIGEKKINAVAFQIFMQILAKKA